MQTAVQILKQIMKYFSLILFCFAWMNVSSQPQPIRKAQTAILTGFIMKDTNGLKSHVDEQFILVHNDGLVEGRSAYIHSYDMFTPDDALSIMLMHESHTELPDLMMVRGTMMSQWMEADRLVRSKKKYLETYQNKKGNWMLVSLYLNDNGEDYYALADTSGIRNIIAQRYKALDRSVMDKDICAHLALKSSDFSTVDHLGNSASPKFMRSRSENLFKALRDSVSVTNTIESLEFAEDTVKATVLQSFKRRQIMAGKTRYVESSARQRESWMLTRDGWKLVYVDKVKPLTRIVDRMPTDPAKPFDPKAVGFKN
jgi:hypothetical protein